MRSRHDHNFCTPQGLPGVQPTGRSQRSAGRTPYGALGVPEVVVVRGLAVGGVRRGGPHP